MSGSVITALIWLFHGLSESIIESLTNKESNGVEYGIVVDEVINLLFHFIFKLYLWPSSENVDMKSSVFVKIGIPKLPSINGSTIKFILSISVSFSNL